MKTHLNLPFTGFTSFCRFPVCTDLSGLDADIAIVGIPFDEGSPWYPGARLGPRRIRELSLRYAGYGGASKRAGYFDPDTGRRYLEYEILNQKIWDCGDVDILYTNVEGTFNNITETIKTILKRGAIPVSLGGDHAITFPIVRSFEEPIQLVHFDAHLDFRQFAYGITMSNGHPIRRIAGLPNVGQIVQIGIRGLRVNQDDWDAAVQRGNKIITANRFRELGISEVLRSMPQGGKTYVTIDMDVLDPPLIPGSASKELGGLHYDELRKLLFGVAECTEVVGFDVVEVNPMLDDRSNATSLWAAQISVEFISRIVLNPAYLKKKDRKEPTL